MMSVDPWKWLTIPTAEDSGNTEYLKLVQLAAAAKMVGSLPYESVSSVSLYNQVLRSANLAAPPWLVSFFDIKRLYEQKEQRYLPPWFSLFFPKFQTFLNPRWLVGEKLQRIERYHEALAILQNELEAEAFQAAQFLLDELEKTLWSILNGFDAKQLSSLEVIHRLWTELQSLEQGTRVAYLREVLKFNFGKRLRDLREAEGSLLRTFFLEHERIADESDAFVDFDGTALLVRAGGGCTAQSLDPMLTGSVLSLEGLASRVRTRDLIEQVRREKHCVIINGVKLVLAETTAKGHKVWEANHAVPVAVVNLLGEIHWPIGNYLVPENWAFREEHAVYEYRRLPPEGKFELPSSTWPRFFLGGYSGFDDLAYGVRDPKTMLRHLALVLESKV